MKTNKSDIQEVMEQIVSFTQERDWDQFHNGKDLALALSIEASELNEAFLCIIRKSKFPQNPKRSVRFSGKRTKRSVQKRKARNTQKAETKVL